MKAVVFDQPGDESVLRIGDAPRPELTSSSVRIRIHATAVNRADLSQRRGSYPPPPGASEILGLECSGEIIECGSAVTRWQPGDRVMALLPGGGYAEESVVDEGTVMRLPSWMTFEQGAATPEVFLTAFLNIFLLGEAKRGDTVLVHGGGSGVGTAAISLCKAEGIRILVTAGSPEKCARCLEHGADVAINYNVEDFATRIAEETSGRGVDVILDSIGAKYLTPNITSLAVEGRLVLIGGMGGYRGEIDLGELMKKRARLIGSVLRGRPVDQKGDITRAFVGRFEERLEKGEIRPVIDRVLPLSEVAEAHRLMKASAHFGKIVLRVRD